MHAETDVIVENNRSFASRKFIESLLESNGHEADWQLLESFMLRGLISTLIRDDVFYFSIQELHGILSSFSEEDTAADSVAGA